MKFDSIISLGNGDTSASECYSLHKRLARCLEKLSGIQQNSFGDQSHFRKDLAFIKGYIRDVAMALTGESVYFIEDFKPSKTINAHIENIEIKPTKELVEEIIKIINKSHKSGTVR